MPKAKYHYPFPVYQATWADGSTSRMSIWCPAKSPIDPFRGRQVMLSTTKAVNGAQLVAGHIEQSGEIIAHDDLTVAEFKPKRRPSGKAVGQVLSDLLTWLETGEGDDSILTQAQEMAEAAA